MRQILKAILGPTASLAAVAALAAVAFFAFAAWRDRQAFAFASSAITADSPIAELATRKVVWKVVHVGSTASTDTVRETVYTVKVGYDLARAAAPSVDTDAKTVTLSLPPPKIVSIDHVLSRKSFEKKTLVERIFGENRDDGRADREDLATLASDCEKFSLLTAEKMRESMESVLAARLRSACGYRLVLKDGRDVPVKAMFNAYFEEKGVDFRLP